VGIANVIENRARSTERNSRQTTWSCLYTARRKEKLKIRRSGDQKRTRSSATAYWTKLAQKMSNLGGEKESKIRRTLTTTDSGKRSTEMVKALIASQKRNKGYSCFLQDRKEQCSFRGGISQVGRGGEKKMKGSSSPGCQQRENSSSEVLVPNTGLAFQATLSFQLRGPETGVLTAITRGERAEGGRRNSRAQGLKKIFR